MRSSYTKKLRAPDARLAEMFAEEVGTYREK